MPDSSDTPASVVSRLGSSSSQCSGKIHSSDTDCLLEHCSRSCESQKHLKSEQAIDRSGLGTEEDDYNSACSNSESSGDQIICLEFGTSSYSSMDMLRRDVNHPGIQKMEQHFSQKRDDSMSLAKRVLALDEKSLQKLSESSSTLSALAGYIMNTEKSQRLPQVQGE